MNLNLQLAKDFFELLSFIAVLLGIPLALFQYVQSSKSQRVEQLFNTYNTVDEKYLEFLRVCIDYPYLDVFDVPHHSPVQLNDEQKRQEQMALTMLISIFELAFLTYQDHGSRARAEQWTAWERNIANYCSRRNFQVAWENDSDGYTYMFKAYMESVIRQAKAKS